MRRVSYIFPTSHHYRLPFHERLRDNLAARGVEYTVIYCDPSESNLRKGDTVEIPWGVKVPLTRLTKKIVYQHGLYEACRSDLVIVQQENGLLLNYLLQLLSELRIKRVAFFGHGRNFQARNAKSAAEQWKRFWATKVDWWFGYTNETREHLRSLGFPAKRITVFNNAVDTRESRALVAAVTSERLEERRAELGIRSGSVGVFVGGLYEDKRLTFLVNASDKIRARVNDFTLIVVGGGEQLPLLEELAATRAWIKVMGPRFGVDKLELMMLGRMFLMPGLVGLAVVDAGTAGLPTITTAFPFHSPEIAYVDPGVNGVVVSDWQSTEAYANAVVELLTDPSKLNAMSGAAEQMAEKLTIEAMADSFANGVIKALNFGNHD